MTGAESLRAVQLMVWCLAANGALAAPQDFDIERYDVTVKPDVEKKSIAGSTLIALRALRDGVSQIDLTQNALQIASVRGGTIDPAAPSGTVLKIKLDRPLRRNERTKLEFSYAGKPLRGLIFDQGVMYTSYFACEWMICTQDRPGDKAALKLTLDFPTQVTAVGPGRSTGNSVPSAIPIHQIWQESRPYPTYTFGFAAGSFTTAFDKAGDVTLAYFAAPGTADSEKLRRLFETTPQMLAFFQDKSGVPFPNERYTQILVNGMEAQEGSNLSIIGTRMIEPILTNPQEDWVIAHELAHQWWGNLLTCADWSEFWLNEGVVVFMTAAWKEHKHGRAAYDREIDLARKRLAEAAVAGFDKPLAWTGEYPSLRIRRAVQYSKGALFLDALRSALGEKAFWAGLKLYTQSHAGGVVTSRDFQRAMETASQRNLDQLFKAWVTG